jgi:putative phage-type endonuclease
MSFYLVDDIEQGTDRWHMWRRGVIGASEAVIIMGENRWKGRQQLMDEKLGLVTPFSGNAATQRGHDLEPHARKALEKKFKVQIEPTIVQDSSHPFLAASLDGITADRNEVFEIKCGVKAYEIVSESRRLPSYYVAQVQHMMMITQHDSLKFAAYSPGDPLVVLNVKRDERYIKRLRQRELDFVRELESRGHKLQYEFRGYQVGGSLSKLETAKGKAVIRTEKPEWRTEAGLLRFWDGSDYLEGEEPGLYVLLGEEHYWDGEEWFIPDEADTYNLNGEEHYWNGRNWE